MLEIADMIAVNKADGDNVKRARLAAADLPSGDPPDDPGVA